MKTISQLSEYLKGRVAVVGVGDRFLADDAAGSEFIHRLALHAPPSGWTLIDAGTMPENYMSRIIESEPDSIIFADACEGENIVILSKDDIAGDSFSTHRLPLDMCMDYLESVTQASCVLIGIPAMDRGIKPGISDPTMQHILFLIESIEGRIRNISGYSYKKEERSHA